MHDMSVMIIIIETDMHWCQGFGLNVNDIQRWPARNTQLYQKAGDLLARRTIMDLVDFPAFRLSDKQCSCGQSLPENCKTTLESSEMLEEKKLCGCKWGRVSWKMELWVEHRGDISAHFLFRNEGQGMGEKPERDFLFHCLHGNRDINIQKNP